MPQVEDEPHPLDAHAKRDPMTGAAVLVVVIHKDDPTGATAVGRGLVKLLEQRGRAAEFVLESVANASWGEAMTRPLVGKTQPLVLVTTATKMWSLAHLDPMLKAIDIQDHVQGGRATTLGGRLARRIKVLPWRILFANPLLDLHSPCRLHRREALDRIPLQSESRFAEIELIAKATYLKQLIGEVDVPALDAIEDYRPIASDFRRVWSSPKLSPLKPT